MMLAGPAAPLLAHLSYHDEDTLTSSPSKEPLPNHLLLLRGFCTPSLVTECSVHARKIIPTTGTRTRFGLLRRNAVKRLS